MRAVPRLCELYPGICLTTEEKARKNLSQGSRRTYWKKKRKKKKTHTHKKKNKSKIINVKKTKPGTHVWRVPFIISIRHPRLACSIHYLNPAPTSGVFHSLFPSRTHVWRVPFIIATQHPCLTCSIQNTNPTENSQSARSTNSNCTSPITAANITNPMRTPPCNTRESQYEYYTKNTTHFWNYILRYYTLLL